MRVKCPICFDTGCKDCGSSKKQSKYKNKKVIVDSIKFDSLAESEYYSLLKHLKATGKILDFQLQPKFVLQEGFVKDGVKIQPITYKADFAILHTDDSEEIIDVKGQPKLTKEFELKRKMFWFKYPGVKLTLVKKDRNGFKLHEKN
jgi:phage regulator Rha-like protein